jgi:CRISPR-associated exonuclease Cas4
MAPFPTRTDCSLRRTFLRERAARGSVLAFSDLRRAAYCPRQLWYARRDDRTPPADVTAVKRLATRYDDYRPGASETGSPADAPATRDLDAPATRDLDAPATRDLDAPTARDLDAPATRDLDASSGGGRDAPSGGEQTDDDVPMRELLEVPESTWRARIEAASERFDRFPDLCEPAATDVFLSGRECHGVASKVLPDPAVPSVVSPGKPPECGVWEPHAVWAVAAAKALSWERERRVDVAFVEYPAYGEIRRVRVTTRKRAAYRRAIRTVRNLDAPPPRLSDTSKCEPCEYATECGVATRTLRSRLADR